MKGHLRRRGNAWELRAYVGIDPITNRQKYLTRTFRGGEREADEALARFTNEVSGGGHAAQDTTVGDLIRQWLDLAHHDLSPSTVRGTSRPSGATSPQRWARCHWLAFGPPSSTGSMRSSGRRGAERQATRSRDGATGTRDSAASASSGRSVGMDSDERCVAGIATAGEDPAARSADPG